MGLVLEAVGDKQCGWLLGLADFWRLNYENDGKNGGRIGNLE